MTDYGTLNGQPVGPTLPDPVPCERCGHPVWLGRGVVAFNSADQSREFRFSVWEFDFPPPDQLWALTQHICRKG
jgi:hypothetical protein